MTISGLGCQINKSLALCPKVGLHSSVPLLPVGASEHGNHLVKSAGHGDISVGSQWSQQVNVTMDKQEKKKHLSASESTSVRKPLIIVEGQVQAQVAESHNWRRLATPSVAKRSNLKLQGWMIFQMAPQQTH